MRALESEGPRFVDGILGVLKLFYWVNSPSFFVSA